MKPFRIALYPGDGIGPEVTDAAVAVLSAAEVRSKSFRLEFESFDWGSYQWMKSAAGRPLPSADGDTRYAAVRAPSAPA
jgi:isocitrate/isopropylmalate dehydrogenase